ncbi:MAG: TadE/TadG family type IV pilus assembly protein [Terracidiphilus sp.]
MNKFKLKLWKALQSCEDGQALIETALSVPLLLLLLLGAAQFGQVAYAAIEVTNAAKAAAAYGARNSVTAADLTGMQLAATGDAANLPGTSNFTATIDNTKCSCVSTGGTPGTASVAACTSGCSGYVAQILSVSTTATYNPLLFAPGFNASITLHGNATQEVLR